MMRHLGGLARDLDSYAKERGKPTLLRYKTFIGIPAEEAQIRDATRIWPIAMPTALTDRIRIAAV
jgi:hypothetical protein